MTAVGTNRYGGRPSGEGYTCSKTTEIMIQIGSSEGPRCANIVLNVRVDLHVDRSFCNVYIDQGAWIFRHHEEEVRNDSGRYELQRAGTQAGRATDGDGMNEGAESSSNKPSR